MGLPFRAAAAAALLAVALTGCGTEASPTASGSGAGTSARQDAAEAESEARARHDRMFTDVAARCAGRGEPVDPTPSRTAENRHEDGGPQPENPRYAENHAFKQQAPMDGDALCRGTAHADRIARELTVPGGSAAPDAQRVLDGLIGLGYPKKSVHVSQWSDRVRFTVSVPEAGPCVTGDIVAGQDTEVSPHGVYLEGGCVEPVGGH
ncbi:hypothetical protein [Streptomyces peucetius]|uniref:Lipoprotein n=1 Tax=Streptomyces peucetius TaxID=1950 RepID=A0ABY6I0G8_STRPE|nr:hypothetical protein [Streptomyces peucetius]UYQ60466.1 hypothetical protein OGH68_02560 [Streptomyces peucetius]